MAIDLKGKKKETKTESHKIEVLRAKVLENVIMFDMNVNGVTIYGCSYKTLHRKDNDEVFAKIGFPSRKGKDDKYYNHVYVKFSDEDIETIEKGIEAQAD
jgi:hypothetical protein